MKPWIFNIVAGLSLMLLLARVFSPPDVWLRDHGATQFLGFAFARWEMDAGGRIGSDGKPGHAVPQTVWTFLIPHWALAVLTGVLPLTWVIRHRAQSRRRRRAAAGLCTECGYDLRASEDKCPECGSAIPARL